MSEPKQWHREAARLVIGQSLHGGFKNINELVDEGERLVAACDPSNADRKSEIGGVDVEKVWVRLCALDKVRPNPDTTDTVLVTKKSLRAAIGQAQKGKP